MEVTFGDDSSYPEILPKLNFSNFQEEPIFHATKGVLEVPDGHFERCRWLIESARRTGGLIADVGCADAFMFRDHPEFNVVYLDIAKSPLLKRLTFVQADAHHLPFRDKTFNTVILGDILEHVKDPPQVLREAKRVANHIYATTPNEWEWDETKRPFQFAPHIRFYTEETLTQDLELSLKNTFEILKIRGGGWAFFAIEWHEAGYTP